MVLKDEGGDIYGGGWCKDGWMWWLRLLDDRVEKYAMDETLWTDRLKTRTVKAGNNFTVF